jgi:apolipoprotein D and lipocalin family protein
MRNGMRQIGVSKLLLVLAAMLLTGCLGMPQSVTPVQGFDADRYLGKWYEIARLDHSFEEGLDRVTAEYSLREDGGLTVTNRGFFTSENEWQEAQGKAFFVNGSDEGYLKVSFFGPFYGSYIVFELDKKDYQYAFVSGPDTSYLWLLARTPKVEPALIERFVAEASRRGFDTSKLIFPTQE